MKAEDLAHPGSILEVNPSTSFNPRNEPPCEGSHNRGFIANAIDCDVFVPNQGFQFLPSSCPKRRLADNVLCGLDGHRPRDHKRFALEFKGV